MTMKRKITFEANSHPEDIQALSNGIITYAKKTKGLHHLDSILYIKKRSLSEGNGQKCHD